MAEYICEGEVVVVVVAVSSDFEVGSILLGFS